MKTINKTLLVLIMAIAVISIYTSCKKDSAAEPRIKYVRITSPQSSDSLLIGAGQGHLIAIMGENLQDAVEVWFNDQRAVLTPTYITSTSILVTVPSKIPTDISNKLKIIFKNGYTLLYDFEVQISKPVVNSMLCEYVNEGDIATINGDFFYTPVTVTFTGGVTGDIVSLKDQEIQVKVPAGAQEGPITVKTNFGETKSNFWFRDSRNMVITSDPYEGWHDPQWVVTNPGPNDPPKINGNYIRVKGLIAEWSWNEIADGDAGSMPNHSKNIPDAAILKPEDYNVKFEINTMKPYNNGMIRLNIGIYDFSQADNSNYAWQPPYDTKGKWQTVVIPFEQMVASYKVKPVVNPNGYWTRLLMQGPGNLDADISFDNFRVVPKVDK